MRTRTDLLVPGFLAAIVVVVGAVAAVMFVVVELSAEPSCVEHVDDASYAPLNGVTMTRAYESVLEPPGAYLPPCELEDD